MLGVTFKNVAGSTDGIKLSELIGDFVSYDEIQVSYMEDGLINFNAYQYLTEEDGVEKNGWYDGSWEFVEAPIAAAGQGFWLILSDCANVTLTEKSPISE